MTRHIATGLASRIPGIYRLVNRKGTGGTDSAAYCYGVWLKHWTLLAQLRGGTPPRRVAEIGPGDSLGVGIAALLSGAVRYDALDVYRYATDERTLRLFDQLVAMFRSRAPRPMAGWPDFDQLLAPDLFPHDLLSHELLAETLRPERLRAIRAALTHPGQQADGIVVDYRVPWADAHAIEFGSVDLVISHSVLEHVVDVAAVQTALNGWLAPGGWVSHQIDFTSHGLSRTWNGHWAYGDLLWWIILGKRPFLINRLAAGQHLDALRTAGFDVRRCLRLERGDGLARQALSARFRSLSDLDVATAGLFVQATKPGAAA